MKNKKSIYLIVAISVLVALLHLVTGDGYNGPFRIFINSYLIDILLPMNLYLLLQIALRKQISVTNSRIAGFLLPLIIGMTVEVLQYHKISLFGSTYDFVDMIMYAAGVIFGLLLDLLIISKLESNV